MTSTPPVLDRPETSDDTPDQRPRIQLSATQLIASALAAVTATIAASFLGVAGTVIGAAVASVLTVTGNAVYSHSIQRTSQRVRTVVPAATRFVPGVQPPAAPAPRSSGRRPRRLPWKLLLAASVGLFVGVLGVITVVELIVGRPVSAEVRGDAGSGTSLLGTVEQRNPAPAPRPTVTVTPKVVTRTPTITVTAPAQTRTVHPTVTTSPSGASSPTGTPTPSPTTSSTGSPRP